MKSLWNWLTSLFKKSPSTLELQLLAGVALIDLNQKLQSDLTKDVIDYQKEVRSRLKELRNTDTVIANAIQNLDAKTQQFEKALNVFYDKMVEFEARLELLEARFEGNDLEELSELADIKSTDN